MVCAQWWPAVVGAVVRVLVTAAGVCAVPGRVPSMSLTMVVRGVGCAHPVDPLLGVVDRPPGRRGGAVVVQVGHAGREDGDVAQERGEFVSSGGAA